MEGGKSADDEYENDHEGCYGTHEFFHDFFPLLKLFWLLTEQVPEKMALKSIGFPGELCLAKPAMPRR